MRVGAFVEIYSNVSGLIHITQGGRGLVKGRGVNVELINIDERDGKTRLSFRRV